MATTITVGPGIEARLPARKDGSPWPLLLVQGDRITGADTATELLGQLIPGYADLSPTTTPGTTMRCGCAMNPPSPPPSNCRRRSSPRRPSTGLDAAAAGEEALTALLPAKTTPYTGRAWRGTVPLVLTDTDYQPFTSRPRPEGRINFLRPAQEHDYLASLAEAGVVQYLVVNGT